MTELGDDDVPPDGRFDDVPLSEPDGSADEPIVRPPLRIASRDMRPDVRLVSDVHRVTEDMGAALLSEPALYQRAHELVHVLGTLTDDGTPGAPVVRAVPLSWLVDRVSENARCVVRRKDEKKGVTWSHVPPPTARVKAVLERGEWRGMRCLDGVIEAPSLRPDGTVLQTPGYDAATRSLYAPNADFLPVADEPTHSDAVLAWAKLAEVFQDFPYVSPEHMSAVVALVLTLLARPAIRGSVPCWLFDASSKRSGKSLQVDVASLICFGRKASRVTFPEEDEELEKVLAGYATNAARFIPFDNVARDFGGAALDKCITATDTVDIRVLGKTGQVTLPWRAVIVASGNNVNGRGDMLPRLLAPRLESTLENPETRTDLHHPDLRAFVSEHRTELVHAALTLLRAYLSAGSPPQPSVRQWGGFEQWTALIPQALVWVGAPDPMGARRGLEGDDDPTAAAEVSLLLGWETMCRRALKVESGMTSTEALALIYPAPKHDEEPDGYNDLREAIENLTNAKPGFAPSSKRLGANLRKLKNRAMSGRKLNPVMAREGVVRWRVDAVRLGR